MKSHKNLPFIQRLGFAKEGLWFALKNEQSFRTHTLIAASLLFLSLIVRPSFLWAAIFSLCVGCVLSFELFNTAIESICDFYSPQENVKIKIAKDCAAAGVLISSISSILVFIFFLFSLKQPIS